MAAKRWSAAEKSKNKTGSRILGASAFQHNISYVVAALSAGAIVTEFKLRRAAVPFGIATVILGGADLDIGGYIAYAGGHIRHKEFRFEPPPPPRGEEHHHEYEH